MNLEEWENKVTGTKDIEFENLKNKLVEQLEKVGFKDSDIVPGVVTIQNTPATLNDIRNFHIEDHPEITHIATEIKTAMHNRITELNKTTMNNEEGKTWYYEEPTKVVEKKPTLGRMYQEAKPKIKRIAKKIREEGSELYNEAVVAARNAHDEHLREKDYKAKIIIETADKRRLVVDTHGEKGRILLDDFDENKIRTFLGHDLGNMRDYILKGKRYADVNERITYEFNAPVKEKKTVQIERAFKGVNHWEPLETGGQSAAGAIFNPKGRMSKKQRRRQAMINQGLTRINK